MSVRRGQENQWSLRRFERAAMMWTWPANSHTGPRHVTIAANKAGHMSAPDHAQLVPKIPLAAKGASTHETPVPEPPVPLHNQLHSLGLRAHSRVCAIHNCRKITSPARFSWEVAQGTL